MNQPKIPLNDPIVGITCFSTCQKYNVTCKKDTCRSWINAPPHLNCTLIASMDGKKTLQEIGDIFGITRMRICQLEKAILKKLQNRIGDKDLIHPTKH